MKVNKKMFSYCSSNHRAYKSSPEFEEKPVEKCFCDGEIAFLKRYGKTFKLTCVKSFERVFHELQDSSYNPKKATNVRNKYPYTITWYKDYLDLEKYREVWK